MKISFLLTYACVLGAALLLPPSATAARRELALHPSRVELPGPPARILSADVDGDGRRDLVVLVAYSSWGELGITESVEMDDIEGLVETLTVVPAIFDRREIHVFLADPAKAGAFLSLAEPLPLTTSVVALEHAPSGLGIMALTDDGLSLLRLDGSGSTAKARLAPYLTARSVLRGSGDFLARLELVFDLDGDGDTDLVFPAEEGLALYRNGEQGLDREPYQTLAPGNDDRRRVEGQWVRRYPLPQVRDVDGDHLPDLLFPGHRTSWRSFYLSRGQGGGRFAPPRKLEPLKVTKDDDRAEEVVYFGDLDGDGSAEWLTRQSLEDADAGLRKGLEEAKRPPALYRFYRNDRGAEGGFALAAKPYFERKISGHIFTGAGGGDDGELQLPGGLIDLDHDGRLDLVAVALDFSMLQAVRILAVRSLSMGLDFEVFCQDGQGRLNAVAGLDLSGHFHFDLETMKLGQLPFFSGDFDGDGRADYVQLGRGRKLAFYRGQEGCRFPKVADLELELDEEPRDLGLVRIEDLDADGSSDLWILRPQKAAEAGVSPRTRLDLYLSGGGAR